MTSQQTRIHTDEVSTLLRDISFVQSSFIIIFNNLLLPAISRCPALPSMEAIFVYAHLGAGGVGGRMLNVDLGSIRIAGGLFLLVEHFVCSYFI